MHGLIFLQLQRFVRHVAGPAAWKGLLQEAGLAGQSYSPVRDYSDDDVLAIVGAASRALNQPAAAIVEAFGEFIAPELIKLYRKIIPAEWKTLDLIENTESVIHTAVRAGNPGATPPPLQCIRTGEDELQILYSSPRQLCVLAKGIVKGLAGHYGEAVTITDTSCMLKGDPLCTIEVKRVRSPKDTDQVVPAAMQTAAFVEVPVQAVAPATTVTDRVRFPFLRPRQQPSELGRIGEFSVLAHIGEGAMGIVFRGEDPRLGRAVAIKVMKPNLATDPAMRDRFLREARAMAAIKSEYVVTVYDVGLSEGIPFLVMEFLEGESLEQYHARTGHIPLLQAVRIAKEAARGLAAAHSRGLIHRDIKPSNLWLEAPAQRVKILDFGLAREVSGDAQATQSGIVGTPAFMSPEQARGQPVDFRTDLFGLGSVLYWMCTDRLPFEAADVLSTLTVLATQDPMPPSSVSPDVPPMLEKFILHLMRKEPTQRPASAQEVADSLAALEASLTTVGAPVPSTPR